MQRFLWIAVVVAAGCGADSAADQAAQSQRVYWDSETKRPVAAGMTAESPAVHPATGHRTLMPALYCVACKEWRAAPPLAELQRNPQSRQCPKCKGPMIADGPLPDQAAGTEQ